MITTAEPGATTVGRKGGKPPWRNVALVLTAAVPAIAVGWSWGSHQHGVSEKHGTAYSTPDQISVTAGGVTYNVPVRISWLGADKVWNDNSRPACLPPNFQQVPLTFGAVEWKHADLGGYTVAWVDCSQ